MKLDYDKSILSAKISGVAGLGLLTLSAPNFSYFTTPAVARLYSVVELERIWKEAIMP
jgi:hypothetical protein